MAITSAFQADDAGSIPAARSKTDHVADIAQAVERILGKDEVPSSILGISTILKSLLLLYNQKTLISYNHRFVNKGSILWLRLNSNVINRT